MSKYYDRVDEATYLLVDDTTNQKGDKKQAQRKPQLTMVEKAYRSRWISIRLIYGLTFMNYISYTATLASLWAYLKVLEPSARASTMGWVVSAYAMGQIVSGPLFGYWANRRSIKEALVVSLLLNLFAYIFYMYLASLPSHREYYMIAARWLIGFSSGSIPLARTYVANATNLSERTGAIANTNIFGAVGFILGPLLQAALVPISYPGPVESISFHLNMYTAPILLSAIVSFVTVVVIVLAFTEHSPAEEIIQGSRPTSNYGDKNIEVDYIAAVSCIILFYCSFFNFAFLETIIVPLIMHMYAWTKARATLVQSLGIGLTALLSIAVYIIIKWLSKRIQERTLFLMGFIVLVLSYVVVLPFGHVYPGVQMADMRKSLPTHNTTTTNTFEFEESIKESAIMLGKSRAETLLEIIHFYPPSLVPSILWVDETLLLEPSPPISDSASKNGTASLGCPWQYEWCQTVPAPSIFQFMMCMALFGVGYPTTNVLAISIFSKVLGPKPMGLWMGVLIASGCLAGIIGPILQTILYDNFGPRITFLTVGGFMAFTTIFVLCIYKRLRPFGERNGNYSMEINKG